MPRKRLRFAVWPAVAALATGGAVVTAVSSKSMSSGRHGPGRLALENGMPGALARHLERLKALPGNGGEALGGPGSAADAAFQNRAFPDTDIPSANFDNARSTHGFHRSKGFPRGEDRRGKWQKIGPSEAVYPFFNLRDSTIYLPNEYVAGGRTTSLALAGDCVPGNCTLYAGPAGGGIWRTRDALEHHPDWEYLSTPFEINSIGSIAVDPNDATGNTLWVGTGEANACSSGCEAGVGLYKSTDGGDTWSGPLGQSTFGNRGVGTIAVKPGHPNTIYAASTRAIRGYTSSCCSGVVSLIPGAAKWGLYKSTDGGASWAFIHNGAASTAGCTGNATEAGNGTPCSPRGVRRVLLDPSKPTIVYASSYARGVWRSNDEGATWTQIKTSLNPAATTARPEMAVTTLPGGKTRMYVAEGASGAPFSQLFRSDDVATGVPTFTGLTSPDPANPGYGSFDYCTGQCWYDNFVVTPAGHPDMVYLGGSYQYGETGGLFPIGSTGPSGHISNGRGVVLSTDAGVSFTDMTMDATDALHPNGLHPDQHFLVVNPNNPSQFFESSDGGIARSSGQFADVSSNCTGRVGPGGVGVLTGPGFARCQQLLSRVPTQLESINRGLSTLQFQSLSYNRFDVDNIQGGTQDNGTWETDGDRKTWTQRMVGDGGQSGFDVADRHFRFHTFAGQGQDVNFTDGAIADWNWIGDPLFNGEPAEFYVPIISDPRVSGTMYVGTAHVWRTKTHGLGTMTVDELRAHCNEWTGDFAVTCGDWVPLGNPAPTGRLTSASFGTRAGGDVAAVQRATRDTSTLWAATSTGRVFVSKNADAEPASAVSFTRIDLATSPGRYVTGIYIEAAHSNHAWISFDGFNATTPATPGHVFEVMFDPVAGTATWTDRSLDLGDIPITAIVRDDATGDLYAASDFGVLLLDSDETSWTQAAPGMPNVEVAGLTIVPSARKLYAATHGLSAWSLRLRGQDHSDHHGKSDH
jgi:hypothetical protein